MTKEISKSSKVGATAAGAGGGTLLVVLSSHLPEGNPFKQWLVMVAPTLSVTLTTLWYWAQVEIANYIQDKKVEALALKTKQSLIDALNNSNTSESHRNSLRSKLEELEIIISERQMKKLRSLSPYTIESTHKA
ncbi:MAG: hypothetical protein HGB26_00465 [Desulfobulbaceae bacterium]|nr:hypothetical protein [Desulfobulbaceae bacterium]